MAGEPRKHPETTIHDGGTHDEHEAPAEDPAGQGKLDLNVVVVADKGSREYVSDSEDDEPTRAAGVAQGSPSA